MRAPAPRADPRAQTRARATRAQTRARSSRDRGRRARASPRSYDFTVKDLDSNKDVALSAYRGKVSLIVNVASK